jgi:hypothetical protein
VSVSSMRAEEDVIDSQLAADPSRNGLLSDIGVAGAVNQASLVAAGQLLFALANQPHRAVETQPRFRLRTQIESSRHEILQSSGFGRKFEPACRILAAPRPRKGPAELRLALAVSQEPTSPGSLGAVHKPIPVLGLDEKLPGEQPVEEQNDERPTRAGEKTRRADRPDQLSVTEEGNDAAAQNRADNAHQRRTQRTSGVASGHDGLGRQTDQRSEADPQQNLVGCLLED